MSIGVGFGASDGILISGSGVFVLLSSVEEKEKGLGGTGILCDCFLVEINEGA